MGEKNIITVLKNISFYIFILIFFSCSSSSLEPEIEDGDYDIVPVAAGSTDRNSSVGAEIHWRNDGGYFTYQESWIGPYKD